MRKQEQQTQIEKSNSRLKFDTLECENEEDNQEYQLQSNYRIICTSINTTRSAQPIIPFQTTLDQDFLRIFAND